MPFFKKMLWNLDEETARTIRGTDGRIQKLRDRREKDGLPGFEVDAKIFIVNPLCSPLDPNDEEMKKFEIIYELKRGAPGEKDEHLWWGLFTFSTVEVVDTRELYLLGIGRKRPPQVTISFLRSTTRTF